MFEAIGNALIEFIESEIVKHEPEIQQIIIEQLDKLSVLLFHYVKGKITGDESSESLPEDEQEGFITPAEHAEF